MDHHRRGLTGCETARRRPGRRRLAHQEAVHAASFPPPLSPALTEPAAPSPAPTGRQNLTANPGANARTLCAAAPTTAPAAAAAMPAPRRAGTRVMLTRNGGGGLAGLRVSITFTSGTPVKARTAAWV